MKVSRTILGISLVLTVLELSCADLAKTNAARNGLSIPFAATRNDTVRNMLRMADVGKDDVVYDLGSGDGRIVIVAIREFGARRAIGVEIDPKRIQESREKARDAGVTDRVEFIEEDLFTTDFSAASVVTLFLGDLANIRLRSRLLRLCEPGTRIVSHQFGMGEWEADKVKKIRATYTGMWASTWNPYKKNPNVPDYVGNITKYGNSDIVRMWVVPAPVAGIWRGKIETDQGRRDCKLVLHQRFSKVTGTIEIASKEGLDECVFVDLKGGHIRYKFRNQTTRIDEVMFDGKVQQDVMEGILAMNESGKVQKYPWKARRDTVDYTGRWEWPCPSGPRSVQLSIDKREGELTATYRDRNKSIAVEDFYDFGGGFYFTLMINRQKTNGAGYTTKITKDTGWLIGEGILEEGALKGTIEFYPYETSDASSDLEKEGQPKIDPWTPRLIKP